MEFVSFVNILASVSSLLLFLLALVVLIAIETKGAYHEKVKVLVTKNIVWIGLLVSFGSMLLSLVYSNIIGYPPCSLCWYARILLYPQFVIFLMFFWKTNSKPTLLNLSIVLSVIGLVITTYHSIITYVGESPLPCDATVSCTQRFVYEFGFMTIPLMACLSFVALLICTFYAKKNINNI